MKKINQFSFKDAIVFYKNHAELRTNNVILKRVYFAQYEFISIPFWTLYTQKFYNARFYLH